MRFGVVVFPGTWSDGDCYHALKDVFQQPVEYVWHKERDLSRFDCIILPGGLAGGAAGATAEALEEFAHMRCLPYMTVVAPCDALEAKRATVAAAGYPGPVYLRLGRNPVPTITKLEQTFSIGKANTLRDGSDVTFIACGVMVGHSMTAAESLAKEGVSARVINLHTIKPIDRVAIVQAAKETGAIVTAEEHTVLGGLGSAVAEVVVQEHPTAMRFVGVMDRFGTSGDPADLLKAFHLMPDDLVQAARDVLKLKQHPVGSYKS